VGGPVPTGRLTVEILIEVIDFHSYLHRSGFREMHRVMGFILVAGMVLGGLGCGSSARMKGRVPVFEVTGTITYRGSPVADAVVNFVSLQGNPVATGKTDSSGQYFLTTYDARDGAAAGDYIVLATKVEVPPESEQEPMEYPGDQNRSKLLLPAKYGSSQKSPLAATVSDNPSRNHFDFNLSP